ncbi:DNA-directed RNA polymerase subunit D [Candidatus Micrarchaeota archaeon]|nr:DNA-directed RNA polymerase subunit D [Candidatus Micrarchaeota archaeon]
MAMKLEVERESGNKMRFSLSGAPVSFANVLRRYCMSHVPVFAIDSVMVYENTSSLFDEYISNRFGLVPLKMASGYSREDEVLFSLDVRGPCTVYSGDLKSMDAKIKVAPGYDEIPIAKLLEGQSLRLEAKARMGEGRAHAKFQTGLCGYEISNDSYNFTLESFMQLEPRALLLAAATLAEERCEEFEAALEGIKLEGKKSGK